MTSSTITVPNFDFSGFYYQQILEALTAYKRENVPELTDESEFEPFTQLLRAFALVGHLNNVNIDMVANEYTLPTASLVETVRNMLRLIDYEMLSATPSQVDLLYKLSGVFSTTKQLVPERARASIGRSGDDPVIYFEANEAISTIQTDQLSNCFVLNGSTYTDKSTEIVSELAANDFSPWAAPSVQDMIYFGHTDVMWNKLDVTLSGASAGLTGVWEFYDNDWTKVVPDSVSVGASVITVVINGLLGSSPMPGTTVRVTYNETGSYEAVESQWNGSQNFVEIGFLDQHPSPSTTVDDYSVGSDWTVLDDVVDGTDNLQEDGNVEYAVPQTTDKNWIKATVNGTEAYWLRYRIVAVSVPTSPIFRNANIDQGDQYVLGVATQGITTSDNPLGSSTGLADQIFETSSENFIKNSQTITVDGVTWTEVDNFVNSQPADKHYVIQLGENDKASVIFGSGSAGAIPPVGINNIAITYRYNAQYDGNVGPSTIETDKTGLTYISEITNPRQASGWSEADGSSDESLARVKIEGPASLKTKEVAISSSDVITLTKAYTDEFGTKPFSRALVIEEGLGAKTMELVVVLKGGSLASTDQLNDLTEYFNGDKYSVPQIPQKIVANQEVTAFNYTQREIDITATVTATSSITVQEITNQLNQILRPEVFKEDGITYEWQFGGEVTLSRINHEIFKVDETITKVEITTPSSDIQLNERELPIAGTLSITVVEV
jgi:hypothetical protein